MTIADNIKKARELGYKDEEIANRIAEAYPDIGQRMGIARQSGFSDSDILAQIAVSKEANAVQNQPKDAAQLQQAIASSQALTPLQQQLNQAIYDQQQFNKYAERASQEGIGTEFVRGLQESSLGRYIYPEDPKERAMHRQYAPEPGFIKGLSRVIGEGLGDIIPMAAGALGGGVGGALVGTPAGPLGVLTGAYAGAGAGSMAFPEALKQVKNSYDEYVAKGGDLSFGDYFKILKEGIINPEVLKAAGIGVTLSAVAPAVGYLAKVPGFQKLLSNPKVAKAAVFGGEVGLLGAEKGIEKGELPSAKDLAEIATQILFFKLAGGSASQLKKLYNVSKEQLQKGLEKASPQDISLLANPDADINSSEFRNTVAKVLNAARKEAREVKAEAEEKAVAKEEGALQEAEKSEKSVREKLGSLEEQKRATVEAIQQLQKVKGKTPDDLNALTQLREQRDSLTKQIEKEKRRLVSEPQKLVNRGIKESKKTREKGKLRAERIRSEAKRKAEAAKASGLISVRAGDIDPLAPNPNKRIDVRYVPREKSDLGKSSSEVIEQYVGEAKPPSTGFQKIVSFVKEAAKSPQALWRKIYTGVVDKGHVLKQLETASGKEGLKREYEDAKRVSALVEHELLYGELDPDTASLISDNSLKKVVEEALPEGYGEEGRGSKELNEYLAAASSVDATNMGLENPIPTLDSETIQKERSFFKPVAKAIQKFMDRYLDLAERSGLLSPQSVKAMRELHKTYAPLHRVFEEGELSPAEKKSMLAPFKRAKGSKRKIENPIPNIIKNILNIRRAIAQNNLANNVASALEKLGFKKTKADAPSIKNAQKQGNEKFQAALKDSGGWFAPDAFTDGKETLYGYSNGKRWKIEGVPKEVASLFRAPAQANAFVKAWRTMVNRFSRAVTAWNLVSNISINARDMMDVAASSRGTLGFIDFYREFPAAVASVMNKDARFQQFVRSGLYTHTFRGMHKVPFQETITDIFGAAKDSKNKPLQDRAIETLGAPFKALKLIGNTLESLSEGWSNSTRLAWLETEIKRPEYKGMSRESAMRKAKDVGNERLLQFDRRGGFELIDSLARAIPFFNTTIQDTATLARKLKSADLPFFANSFISLTVPSLFLHAEVMNDERYKRLQDYEKQNNWAIRPSFGIWDDGTQPLILIPKPWNLGYLMGTIPEMFYDYIYQTEGEKSATDMLKKMFKGEFEQINPLSFPIWGKGYLIPRKLERVAATEQYTPDTSLTARGISKLLEGVENVTGLPVSVSPIYVDAAIRFAGTPLAREGLKLVDELLFYAGVVDDRRPEAASFASTFLSRYYAKDKSLKSSYLNEFYDLAEQMDRRMATYTTLKQRGETDKALKLEEGGLYRTTKARKEISGIFRQAEEINNAPLSEISRPEKQKYLKMLAKEMDEVSKAYISEMTLIKQQINKEKN